MQELLAEKLALACAERILTDEQLALACRIDLHPNPRASVEELRQGLRPWARWAKTHHNVRFSFDREKTHLAEGLTWLPGERSAVYQYVGLRLPLLYRRLGRGHDDETLFHRLGLLCESAVRAGVQKREFLRQQQPSFFGGRDHQLAVVVVVPMGLDAMIAEMIGKPMSEDEASVAFAEQMLSQMSHRLRREGRHYQLRCAIDGIPGTFFNADRAGDIDHDPMVLAGNTPAVPGSGPRHQLAAASKLHATTRTGTVHCRLPDDHELDVDQLLELLLFAARQTDVCRVRFLLPTPVRQAPLADDWLR